MKNLNQVFCHLHSFSQPRYPRFVLCPDCRQDAPHEALVVEAVVNFLSLKFCDFFVETEYEIQMGSEKRRADVLLVSGDKQNTLIVECKREDSVDEEDGISQLKSYMCATDTPIGIFANSRDTDNWRFFEHFGRNKFSEITWDQFWTKVIEFEPGKAYAYFYWGLAKVELGKYYAARGIPNLGYFNEAIEDYNIAIKLKPDFGDAYYFRGRAKIKLRQYNSAIADYDKAIELKPDSAYSYYERGNAMATLGQRDQAIADYDKAIELKPDYAYAYCERGIEKDFLRFSSKKYGYDEVLADFNKAIELKPNYARAYQSRGSLKRELKEYDAAISDYDKAIELNPDYALVYEYRGRLNYYLKKYDAAISDYDKAIELRPENTDAYQYRAEVKIDLSEYDAAIEDYDKIIELEPDSAYAYNLRGDVKLKLNQYDAAIADFDKAKLLDTKKK